MIHTVLEFIGCMAIVACFCLALFTVIDHVERFDYLEHKVDKFNTSWEDISSRIDQEIDNSTREMASHLMELNDQYEDILHQMQDIAKRESDERARLEWHLNDIDRTLAILWDQNTKANQSSSSFKMESGSESESQ